MRCIPILSAALLALSAGLSQAATPTSACTNLGEARAQLVAMIIETDPGKLDDYKDKVRAASNAVDADLAAMAGGSDAAKVNAFKPAWEAFKKTRETEIIPALYAGDKEKAKGIATGVQAQRIKTMKAAMGCNRS